MTIAEQSEPTPMSEDSSEKINEQTAVPPFGDLLPPSNPFTTESGLLNWLKSHRRGIASGAVGLIVITGVINTVRDDEAPPTDPTPTESTTSPIGEQPSTPTTSILRQTEQGATIIYDLSPRHDPEKNDLVAIPDGLLRDRTSEDAIRLGSDYRNYIKPNLLEEIAMGSEVMIDQGKCYSDITQYTDSTNQVWTSEKIIVNPFRTRNHPNAYTGVSYSSSIHGVNVQTGPDGQPQVVSFGYQHPYIATTSEHQSRSVYFKGALTAGLPPHDVPAFTGSLKQAGILWENTGAVVEDTETGKTFVAGAIANVIEPTDQLPTRQERTGTCATLTRQAMGQ